MVSLNNLGCEGVRGGGVAGLDADVVIEIECEAEGVEARAKVGGRGWNANPERRLGGFHRGGNRKNFSAAEVVSRAISFRDWPRREATFSAIVRVKAGSHRFPR